MWAPFRTVDVVASASASDVINKATSSSGLRASSGETGSATIQMADKSQLSNVVGKKGDGVTTMPPL